MIISNYRTLIYPLLFIIAFINLHGCSEPSQNLPRVQPPDIPQPSLPAAQPPSGFDIEIRVQDYVIVNHKILGYDPTWGEIRFAGKFAHLDNLAFKFKSDKFPEFYWIAMLPILSNGSLEVRAIKYTEPSSHLRPVQPPERITVSLIIRNGRVENHSIQNPHPGWGVFNISSYKMPILFVKNSFYPGCIWQGKMPTQDGAGEIYLVLQSHNCDNKG